MSADTLALHTHRWIPTDEPAKSPTLLLLHGTGGDENDLLKLGADVLPKANILSPRGNVLENGMPRFFRRLREGVFDEPDILRRAADLNAWTIAAADAYRFERSRLMAFGYSNGANIAAAMMLLHPGSIRAAVLLRAMRTLSESPRGNPTARPPSPPVALMLSGSADPIVPAPSAEALADQLTVAGVAVTHTRLNAGHQLSRQDLIIARAWLATAASG